MNKLIKAICLSIVLSVAAFAQTDNTDEYNKNEFYVGYSNQQVEVGPRRTFNGFEVSYTRNVSRFFGIKADVSGAYRNSRTSSAFSNGTVVTPFTADQKNSIYNFLGAFR